MKKWLITLSIIFGVGFISSAVLAGRVYYSDLQTYEDYDKKEINKQALENVYITSDVPIEIQPTTGEPYAEFSQTFTDLVGYAPKYKLEIEEKGDSTHISLDEVESIILWLGVKKNEAKLTVYLPKDSINRLQVQSNNYQMLHGDKQMINLESIDVEELNIDAICADINLEGTYNKVNIVSSNGSLTMHSEQTEKLSTSGMWKQNISGEFEKIKMESARGELNIDSWIPCKVDLEGHHNNIHLEGQYEQIKLNGYGMEVELNSETECKLMTKGNDNTIYANGAFDIMDLQEADSEIEVQTTVIPTSIKMLGEARGTSLSLTLPSNIQGLTLKYVNQDGGAYDYYYDEEQVIEPSFADHEFKLESDFLPFNQEIQNGNFIYQYGNGEVPITLNQNVEISLELIDGGYTSVSKTS